MEETPDYESVATEADRIDAASAGQRATIDVDSVFANRIEVKKVDYAEIDKMLEGVEAKKGEAVAQAQQQAQAQAQAPAQVQVQVPKQEIAKEISSASKRLRDAIGRAGMEFEREISVEIEKERERGLVMPKLSLQDQLSDLEKIGEGLEEGAFDSEQLKVIRDEVKALSAIAGREEVSKYPEDQRELVLVRGQKIKEIKTRLNIR